MLLDINVLIALIWTGHTQHERVAAWSRKSDVATSTFAVCRVSEMGLLRLLTNSAAMQGMPFTQRQAWQRYDLLLSSRGVKFLQEPEGVSAAFRRNSGRDEISPKRWTDDYLLAFAEAMDMPLVTLDKPFATRSSRVLLID